MIKIIDEQSLDVRAIVILRKAVHMRISKETSEAYLIGHQHEPPIAKTSGVLVVLIVLQAENLLDVLDLLVLHDLLMLSIADVE